MAPKFPIIKNSTLYAQLLLNDQAPFQKKTSSGVIPFNVFSSLSCAPSYSQGVTPLTSLKYRLFPTSLPFHPIIDPKEFPTVYQQVRRYLSEAYTKITQPTFAQKPLDEILDALEEFYSIIDYTDTTISSLKSSSPDQTTFDFAKLVIPEFAAFKSPFYNSADLYKLYQELQVRVSQAGAHSKYPLDQVKATIENQLIDFEKNGVALHPNEKEILKEAKRSLKKLNLQYEETIPEITNAIAVFPLEDLVGFLDPSGAEVMNEHVNQIVSVFFSRIFINKMDGLNHFLAAYNQHSQRDFIHLKNISLFLDQGMIDFLKKQYFPTHPDQFSSEYDLFIDAYRKEIEHEFDKKLLDPKKLNIRAFSEIYAARNVGRTSKIKRDLKRFIESVEKHLKTPSNQQEAKIYFERLKEELVLQKRINPLNPLLEIPVSISEDFLYSEGFAYYTKNLDAAAHLYGVSWRYRNSLLTPLSQKILDLKERVKKLNPIAYLHETLYADPKAEISFWLEVGKRWKKIDQINFAQAQKLYQAEYAGAKPLTYETIDLYRSKLTHQYTSSLEKELADETIDFGKRPDVIRNLTMPLINTMFRRSYRELNGEQRNLLYPNHSDDLVFGDFQSGKPSYAIVWDTEYHPYKTDSSVAGGSITRLNYFSHCGKWSFSRIKFFTPPKNKDLAKPPPETTPYRLETSIHEYFHQAHVLFRTPFQNLNNLPDFVSDFPTRFAEYALWNEGIPGGKNIWESATIEDKDGHRRIMKPQEIDAYLKKNKRRSFNFFGISLMQGLFITDIYLNPPKNEKEMSERFLKISEKVFNESFNEKNAPYAFARAWNGQFPSYGPQALITYLLPQVFYPYLSSIFKQVGGSLHPDNIEIFQKMIERLASTPPPRAGGGGFIQVFESSLDLMLAEIHSKYGERAKEIPDKFQMPHMLDAFERYYSDIPYADERP